MNDQDPKTKDSISTKPEDSANWEERSFGARRRETGPGGRLMSRQAPALRPTMSRTTPTPTRATVWTRVWKKPSPPPTR